MVRRHFCGPLVLATAFLLAACDDPPADIEEPVRALKTITVTEVASGQIRKFSGVVQATDTSSLSFPVGGKVEKVSVNLGDRVDKDQVLAVLDKKPYELNVKGAEASLRQARADLKQKQLDFERSKTLYEKGWVAKAAFDQASAALQSAESSAEYALSQVNLAKRDLGNTTLHAPFAGTIAKRNVEPFVEVGAGQVLFEINAAGALEVAVAIPETTISRIVMGMPISARFPTAPDAAVNGRVTQIGSAAGSANAFPVNVSLLNPPDAVRSGMTAEVTFTLADNAAASGYLVPFSAIAPGEADNAGYVYVFDRATSTVKKTPVKGRPARDNFVAISEGVAAGDIVAVAGVSFLRDGQKVKLLGP